MPEHMPTLFIRISAGKSMRAVVRSLISVIGGEAAVRAANVVAVLLIARAFGSATLGAYAVSLALVTVVVMFADTGLQTATITELNLPNTDRNQTFSRLATCKTVTLAAALLLLVGVVAVTRPGPLLLSVGCWVAFRAVLQSFSQFQMAALKAVSRAAWIGVIQILHSSLLFAGIWLAFHQHWNIFSLLQWMTFCQFLELAVALAVLERNGIWPSRPRRLNVWQTLQLAAPFGIVFGLANLIVRADTIILSTFAPLTELGAFSAANAILLIVYVCAWLFGSILLPEMVRRSGSRENLNSFQALWIRWVVFLTVPISLLVSTAAPQLIMLMYGPSFAGSGALASVMVLACPFILLNSIYTARALAAKNRALFLGIYGAAAIATLALDVLLGHAFGSLGIAWAIVVREAAMLLAFWLLVSRIPSPASALNLRMSQGGN
jgi:O-antigen/teichoic acid export membrane protein